MKIELITQLNSLNNYGFSIWNNGKLRYFVRGEASNLDGYRQNMWNNKTHNFLSTFRLEIIYDET